MKNRLNQENFKKWIKNFFRFVAPTLAIFFAQLAGGVELKFAIPVALFALYQSLSDYFGKLGSQK